MASRQLFQQEMLYSMFSELQKNNGFYVKPYDLVLRSLPNGVEDEVSDGKLYKRVSDEEVIDGTQTWVYWDSATNTYRFYITGWATGKNIVKSTANTIKAVSNDGDYKSTENSGEDVRLISVSTNENLYIRIEKSKVDAMAGATTLDKFKAYLNQFPITLIYQLAGEIVSELENKKYHDDKEYVTISTNYEKKISYKFYVNGRVVINMLAKRTANEVTSVKISKNGIIEQEVTIDSAVDEYKSIGQFLDIGKDDVLDIEIKTDRTQGGTATLKDFKVYYDYSVPGDAYRLI